jgi:hypothetical protein
MVAVMVRKQPPPFHPDATADGVRMKRAAAIKFLADLGVDSCGQLCGTPREATMQFVGNLTERLSIYGIDSPNQDGAVYFNTPLADGPLGFCVCDLVSTEGWYHCDPSWVEGLFFNGDTQPLVAPQVVLPVVVAPAVVPPPPPPPASVHPASNVKADNALQLARIKNRFYAQKSRAKSKTNSAAKQRAIEAEAAMMVATNQKQAATNQKQAAQLANEQAKNQKLAAQVAKYTAEIQALKAASK